MSILPDAAPGPRRQVFYGWFLVPLAFVCYGMTFSPPYEAWGFFGPSARQSLELSKTQVGAIFGLFSFWYQAASPLTSWLIHRHGLRVTISGGMLVTALGMWMLSNAESPLACYIAYPLVMGTGVALSAVLSMQALATVWFSRYRARAMAVIMAGNTGFGTVLTYLNKWFAEHYDWRMAWKFYAVTTIASAVAIAIFVRNRPQDMGVGPDGVPLDEHGIPIPWVSTSPAKVRAALHKFPTRSIDALLTGQFALLALAGIAYVTAWSTFAAHSGLRLESLGLAATANVIFSKNLFSTIGRFGGALADFMSPPKLLAISLTMEGVGMMGLGYSSTPVVAILCAALFGLGYGTSVVCIALTISHVCGPTLFVSVAGICRMIQGIVSALLPIFAGYIADKTDSYTIPFVLAGLIAIAGAVGSLFCRPLSARETPVAVEPAQTHTLA